MRKLLVFSLIGMILLFGIVIAQGLITFPSQFEVTLPTLPPRISEKQIMFNCPYDRNIEYRMVGVRDLNWNGTIPSVTADIKYWTNARKCSGSVKLNMTLPATLSQSALLTNFQNQINTAFTAEAQSNRQPRNESQYIAGSSSG